MDLCWKWRKLQQFLQHCMYCNSQVAEGKPETKTGSPEFEAAHPLPSPTTIGVGLKEKARQRWSSQFRGKSWLSQFGGQSWSRQLGGKTYSIPWGSSCYVSVYLEETVELNSFFQIDRGKTAGAARNWIKSTPQTDATTFALPSVSILLLWNYLFSMNFVN